MHPASYGDAAQTAGRRRVTDELKKAFRPEFLNRIDDIIVFERLNREQVCRIARKMLDNLCARTAANGITLQFDEKAVAHVADAGFDEIYGARPLRRVIRSEAEDRIAEGILSGEFGQGCGVNCTCEDGKLIFTVSQAV